MNLPPDPGFVSSFRTITSLARNRGLDLAEVLNDHGMLRTDNSIKADQLAALNRLRDGLESIPAEGLVHLMGGHFDNLTPADMLRLTKKWIETFVKIWETS